MPSYNKKQIKYVITIEGRKFTSSGSDTIEIIGYRSSCYIDHAGGAQLSTGQIQIYGLSQSDMNSITTLNWNLQEQNRTLIDVFALDDSNTYETLIFRGNVINAWGVYANMPDVYLHIYAVNNWYNLMTPYPIISYRGSTKISTVIAKITNDLGLHFENIGVEAVLNNPYLTNTAINQIRTIAKHAKVDVYFDNNSVVICNEGQPRGGVDVIINQESGMMNYPTFDNLGVNVEILFNPFLTFGGKITIQSDLPRANGDFTAISISHTLQSEFPNGQYFSLVRGTKSGFAITG
jgi:hypothetical protein